MLAFPWNRGVLPKASVTFGCQQQQRDKPEYYRAVNPTSCWEILWLISKRAGANRSICWANVSVQTATFQFRNKRSTSLDHGAPVLVPIPPPPVASISCRCAGWNLSALPKLTVKSDGFPKLCKRQAGDACLLAAWCLVSWGTRVALPLQNQDHRIF